MYIVTKRKTRLLILCIVILLIAGIAVSYFLPANVPLASLQKGDAFQLRGFRYGLQKSAVKLLWTGPFEVEPLPGQDVLVSKDSAKVNGNPADAYFYFQDGELFQVVLTVKDCSDTWTQNLLEEARQLYGEEVSNANGNAYKWEGEDTLFCISPTGRNQVMLILTQTDNSV